MNVDNENWLIENGVLKEYRGTSKEVEIPEGVREISHHVFQLRELTKVTFPSTLKVIDGWAFEGNKLKVINIPDNVETIATNAFSGNPLEFIKIGKGVLEMGADAFKSMSNILCLEILTTNSRQIDEACPSKIETLIIEKDAVRSIHEGSKILENAREIRVSGKGEFFDSLIQSIYRIACLKLLRLKKVVIFDAPDDLKDTHFTIDYCRFFTNRGINFILEGELQQFSFENGEFELIGFYYFGSQKETNKWVQTGKMISKDTIMYLNDENWLIEHGELVRYRSDKTEVEIPEGVTKIGPRAFAETKVKKVAIPNTVKEIGPEAFYKCQELEEIYIPDSIEHIRESAFSTSALKSVRFGNNLKSIGPYAFNSCRLSTLELPDSLITIGTYAFYDNDLTTVKFGKNIKGIGKRTFSDNYLGKLSLPPSLKVIKLGAFECNGLTTLSFSKEGYFDYVFFQDNPISTIYINDLANIPFFTLEHNDLTNLPSFLKLMGALNGPHDQCVWHHLASVDTVYIENHHKFTEKYVKFLMGLPNLKSLTISSLTKKEEKSLKLALKYLRDRGVEITIGKEIKFPDSENREGLELENLTKDEEINTQIKTIIELTKMMSEDERKLIRDDIKTKIEKYKEDILELEPSYSPAPKQNVTSLTLTPESDIDRLRNNLISYLDNIIMSLNLKKSHLNELNELSRFKKMIYEEPPYTKVSGDYTEESVIYILEIALRFDNKKIRERLESILNESIAYFSKKVVEDDVSLSNQNYKEVFEKKLEELKLQVTNYEKNANNALRQIKSITGEVDSPLGEFIKDIRSVIERLDDRNKNHFKERLNTIIKKQKVKFERITENYEENPDFNLELEFRKDLQALLTELNKIAKQSIDAKNILNGLNNSLSMLEDEEDIKPSSPIEEEIEEILKLLEISNVDSNEKEETIKVLEQILRKWIDIILSQNLDEIEIKRAIENDPFFKEWDNIKPEKIKFTDPKQIILIAILDELYEVKENIEEYIEKNTNYKERVSKL